MLRWLLPLILLAGCAGSLMNPEPLRVAVSDIRLKSLGLIEQRFELALRVGNPNDFDLRIEAVDFELEVNQRPFARGLTRTATLVEARSNSVVRLDAFSASKAIVEQFRTLSPGALKAGVPYRIHGRIKVDAKSAWLLFDHKGVYGGAARGKNRAALAD